MKTIVPLVLMAVLSGCAHTDKPTVAVVGPREMRDEYDDLARRCGVSGALEYELHCGIKEMFANNPRVPLDEARFVADVELTHPLQRGLDGPLDARLTLRERQSGRVVAQVDARADYAISRPEMAVAQLLHQMARGLSEASSSR